MRDLVQLTGLPAPTLHFYAAAGLLPAAQKLGRTQALYPAATVERVRWIRALQQELGLPLRAIKAILDREGQVPVPQVRTRIALGELIARHGTAPVAAATPFQVSAADRATLARLGLIGRRSRRDGGKGSPDDARLLGLLATLQAAGFTPDNGLEVKQLAAFREAVRSLVRTELRHALGLVLKRMGPARTTDMLMQSLPALDELVAFFHHRMLLEEFQSWRALAAEARAPKHAAPARRAARP
ncbi:MAG: hypothetical protein A2X52_14570 [Candidatus Rokubacteria bacterium GWC2_70_16]|nr:MAG: hypothetical protein A2X52_14570 [Candidatus Rokubacteria bacterium GWC2_70_16]